MRDICTGLKIWAICAELEMTRYNTNAIVQMHRRTKGGSLGLEAFDVPSGANLEAVLDQGSKGSQLGEQTEVSRALFSDQVYRAEIYRTYMELVKPRLTEYSLKDMFTRK